MTETSNKLGDFPSIGLTDAQSTQEPSDSRASQSDTGDSGAAEPSGFRKNNSFGDYGGEPRPVFGGVRNSSQR